MEGGVSVTTFPGGREGRREGGRGGTYLGGAGLDMCWGEGGGLQLVRLKVEEGREGGREGEREGRREGRDVPRQCRLGFVLGRGRRVAARLLSD